MHIILAPLIGIAMIILDLYMWALIIAVVMNWLIAFNVINVHNHFVYLVGDFLYRLTEPVLCLVRRVVPVIGGIDLSTIVLILVIVFLKMVLQQTAQQVAILPSW
ncbi:Integral membrane protein YggT, involved in response to extracytoplasmic stress (osmotic shock) [invertebrate metagenome]|uniref:Integral membrane protein YggT, involved in response to extracytoplasmic stress (Osmotic shock) n=1 Tax=invertebrate metagenome TaxID=1711999 RepID=A0A484H563_9ZZZZ